MFLFNYQDSPYWALLKVSVPRVPSHRGVRAEGSSPVVPILLHSNRVNKAPIFARPLHEDILMCHTIASGGRPFYHVKSLSSLAVISMFRLLRYHSFGTSCSKARPIASAKHRHHTNMYLYLKRARQRPITSP